MKELSFGEEYIYYDETICYDKAGNHKIMIPID